MDLQLNKQLFVIGGATRGLGKAVAEQLIAEGALVILVGRTQQKLDALAAASSRVETICGDITQENTIAKIIATIGDRKCVGAVINAGGPPAMPALDTQLQDWDNAYHKVVRWKIALTQALLPKMMENQYGRFLYIESVSVKQPVENLVLSNAMRLAMVGYVKTLSQEIGTSGVTLNILGPGYHATQRLNSLFDKNSTLKGVSSQEIKTNFEADTAVKQLGDPKDFATLAAWLLSPYSKYITGQTITIDSGLVKGVMG